MSIDPVGDDDPAPPSGDECDINTEDIVPWANVCRYCSRKGLLYITVCDTHDDHVNVSCGACDGEWFMEPYHVALERVAEEKAAKIAEKEHVTP